MAKTATEKTLELVTYNTGDVVNAIHAELTADPKYNGITKETIHRVLTSMKDSITDMISKGNGVSMTNFVIIQPAYRAPRVGNNIIDNTPLDIPEAVGLNVRAGKALKDAVKGYDDNLVKAYKSMKK